MNHKEPKPETLLAAVLASEPRADASRIYPYICAKDAESIVRLGNRAAKLAEKRCNGILRYDAKAGRLLPSWTESDDAAAEKAAEKIAAEAGRILAAYGAAVVSVSGDPRGHCLKIRLASGRSNSMDSGVWGV